ncbi:hypothetical protein SLNSH_21770 [Alsobacter soli]|uniref:Glyoxalase-like domain-containing protein n=1 Tax=Alsobacter soli TaxID=2109933 RepID=A0A2T1HMQ8_9HYPH|nr:VOC family protein [Alsobacter soli]PSC02913.1 hypothetical protein SLNSH_21770 [Alsobacter soli]
MANERIRLRQVCVAARDLYATVDDLRAVLGAEPVHGKADLGRYGVPYEPPAPHSAAFFAKHGLVNAMLPVGDDFIEVVAATRPDAPVVRFLQRKGGDAGYMFIVEVDALDPYEERARAAGFRVAGGADYPQYRDLHLDPRDTGGTMLAFSLQREGRPFDGGWYPAGPHWKPSGRSAPALAGAELACRDPEAVARRWSAAIGRPVEGARIRLDGGEVRFTTAGEGTGDSLAAVDVAGLDRARMLQAAKQRGLETRADAARVGGVWFRAV